MTYYKNYKIPHLLPVTGSKMKDGKKVSCMYYKNRMSLDTEVSSWFCVEGEWNTAKYYDYETIKKATDSHASVYIWQFGIDDEIIYGRTLEELKDFMTEFNKINPMLKIVYIQNLGYDFSFISEILEPGEGMYAASYKPYYYQTADNWCFRDLLMLTGYSLANLAKTYGITNKLIGDLDYTDNITSDTKLTDKELAYCAVDIEIIQEYLKILYAEYDPMKVPMTATGIIRRHVRKIMKPLKSLMVSMRPDYHMFDIMTRTYSGGVTHCSNIYSNEMQDDVHSADRASSYPTEMCCSDHFPKTEFYYENPSKFDIDDMSRCSFLYVKFTNIKCKSSWEYLSAHKAQHLYNEIVDNGRLFAADEADYWLTDIDLRLVLAGYDCDYEITELYQATADYLPKPYIEYVLENYGNKTSLKNVPGMDAQYLHSKQIINGLYGMFVTSPVHDEIEFDIASGEWNERALSITEKSDILEDDKPFLYFAWGVYVTALARYELFTPIYGMDGVPAILDDVVYVDTDSVKYIGDHKDSIDAYNERMMQRIEKAASDLNLDINLFMPKDPKGKQHPLGLFEDEGTYDKFLSMGAKKYCTMQNNEFHFTVAGLKKSFVDATGKHPTMTSMNEMYEGSVIPHARTSSIYNPHMNACEVIDRAGNSTILDNQRGIVMYNSPYTFGLSDDYEALLTFNRACGKMNGPIDIIREQIEDVRKELKRRGKD